MSIQVAMDFQCSNIAFVFHIIVELPASLNFFFRPFNTLQSPQSHSEGVIRQYALLLMSSNFIAAAFVNRPSDALSGWVAGALAFYHLGPLWRAVLRVCRGESKGGLESPWVHAITHVACFTTLLMAYLEHEYMVCQNVGGFWTVKIKN